MIQSHRDKPADEAEIGQVVGIDVRAGIDLQAIVIWKKLGKVGKVEKSWKQLYSTIW